MTSDFNNHRGCIIVAANLSSCSLHQNHTLKREVGLRVRCTHTVGMDRIAAPQTPRQQRRFQATGSAIITG
jgi:hypothetical protein